MKLETIFTEKRLNQISRETVVGIDIGSTQAKAVLLHNGELYTALIPTGFFMQETADTLLELLYEQANIRYQDIDYIVSTGYGRIALQFEEIPNRIVTEISCHGMGHLGVG